MPVYNGERYLAEAVESLRRQSYTTWEAIIVDDGSTDGTEGVARGLEGRIRYVAQENQGPAAARNRGLGLARGQLIGFLDVDDLWPEDKLSIQVPYLLNDQGIDVALGRTLHLQLEQSEDGSEQWRPLAAPFLARALGCGLFRLSAFERIGGFDPNLRYGEDLDWLLRARKAGLSIITIEETTLIYRIHHGNMTLGKGFAETNFFHVFRQAIARHRLAQEDS
jgi:glycosyltransferase involved in cell wall biosynthesis